MTQAMEAASMMKGPLVLVSRKEPDRVPNGVEVRKLQLVTRTSRTADWKASIWVAAMYGETKVDLVLPGVTIPLPEAGVSSLMAVMNEEHVDSGDFIRFSKATTLEHLTGLAHSVFPVARSRTVGLSPKRLAMKFAGVAATNIHTVLQASGILQINIKFEHPAEEKALKLAVHTVPMEDAEQVRKQLQGPSASGSNKNQGWQVHCQGQSRGSCCGKKEAIAGRS